jgi:hypothetical protein
MTDVLDSLNIARETTIVTHYNLALEELTYKVKTEPLKTTFYIYAGCVSKDITHEICRRFNNNGIKAISNKGGFILTQYYITADVSLPSHDQLPDISSI